uniref:FG-GAP-like repeat-containing protein n=1 Tax=Roseihalotalea indica TaxID=2867963 RepID=A0AA49GR23_9BACT|nr:FG-GAP-like repeat-containing protein [Tunicatimonas sp. TK19036]
MFAYLHNLANLILCILVCSYPVFGQFGEKQPIYSNIPNESLKGNVDLNQDGYQDLIVFRPDTIYPQTPGGASAGGYYVKYNDGNGQFTTEQLIKKDNTPWTQIMPVDLDNDGLLDLAVYQRDNQKIVWLKNTGPSGSFSWQYDILTDVNISNLTDDSFLFQDINQDQYPDFICDCSKLWYKNSGVGQFNESFTISDNIIQILSVDDLDQDGVVEVLTMTLKDGKRSIGKYEYQTDATWDEEILINEAPDYYNQMRLQTFDLENDDDLDMLFYGVEWERGTGTFHIYENAGGVYNESGTLGTSDNAIRFELVDLDGNGYTDIVSGSTYDPGMGLNSAGSNQTIWFENQSGSFSGENALLEYQLALDVGQYKQSEGQELLTVNNNGHYLFTPAGSDYEKQLLIPRTGAVIDQVQMSEINGDGVTDFLFTQGTRGVGVLLSQSSGGYNLQTLNEETRTYPESVRFADLDNDGDQDAVASFFVETGASSPETEKWEIVWYENEGDGVFGERQLIGNGLGYYNSSLKIFDSNGDGYPEVAAFTSVFQNNNAEFQETENIPAPEAVADFNGDGTIDLIHDGQWYENTGNGNYTVRESVSGTPIDFDGDGDIDLVEPEQWYENDGVGTFTQQPIDAPALANKPGVVKNVLFKDIDGDGDADGVLLSNSKLQWLENQDGIGDFSDPQLVVDENVGLPYFSDTDDDSDPDLYTTVRQDGGDRPFVKYENLSIGGVANPLQLALEDAEGLQNNEVSIPVKVQSGFENITSLAFSLTWDPEVVTYASVEEEGAFNFNTESTESGQLGVQWTSESGVTLSEESTLFTLRLTLNGEEQSSTELTFGDEPVVQSATNAEGKTIELEAQTATISIAESQAPNEINLTSNIIGENHPVGTLVGTFSTQDADNTEGFTYTLVEGDGDSGNSAFAIDNVSLITAEELDFETTETYSIRVQTTDPRGKSFIKVFEIAVQDLDDSNQVPTNLLLSNNIIAENQPAGTIIGTLTTADPDDNAHTYTLIAGEGNAHNSFFYIDGDELRSAASFDYETLNQRTIRIQTKDERGGTFSKQFTILITDVEDAENSSPTDIQISNQTVAEEMPVGTLVGNLSTVDPDADDEHMYRLVEDSVENNNANFSIDGDQLLTAEIFDYETQSQYIIRVQTDDGQGGTYKETLVINITNTDEATPLAVVNPIEDQQVAVGEPFSLAISDDVFQGDSLSLSVTLIDGAALPGWLTFNAENNTLSGTPPEGGVDLTIKVTATNPSSNRSVSDEFILSVQGVTAIGDDMRDEIRVFPVPADRLLHIEIDRPSRVLQSYRLLDTQGRVMKEQTLSQREQHGIRINVAAFNRGIYFLEVHSNNGSWRQRVLIQ